MATFAFMLLFFILFEKKMHAVCAYLTNDVIYCNVLALAYITFRRMVGSSCAAIGLRLPTYASATLSF